MGAVFQTVLTTSFHGSIVILAVMILRLILKKAPKKFICLLWMLAGIRLLMPIPIESAYSLQPSGWSVSISGQIAGVLAAVWLILAGVIGIYSLGSYLHLRQKVRDAVKIPGGWESDRIETAFVLGFLKPRIYIPTGMSDDIRTQILAHERTHLDKGDHWIKMIGFLALAMHWFNPLVWISYVMLCKDMELACDERVVQFMELEERKRYSTALLQCSTNRVHYAACPVAFGEVSVRYRIKAILNYRKSSFWFSLLAILAMVFVCLCLLTSPKTVVEVPVDADEPLRQISQEDPDKFTPAPVPITEPNPDWGITVYADITTPTGGTIVYAVEERFAAASGFMDVTEAYLEVWDGSAWQILPSLAGQVDLLEFTGVGFAQHREYDLEYFETAVDWTLYYGPLPAGDYRICQTIRSASESATFRTVFRIHREKLPSEEEAALERCQTALDTLVTEGYSVLISETGPDGNVYPVRRITSASGEMRIDHYLGNTLVSSSNDEHVKYNADGWQIPFCVDQNRRFLFPEGKSKISAEEITFCSAWTDFQGDIYQGIDTYCFNPDGSLKSAERTIQKVDEEGSPIRQGVQRMEVIPTDGLFGYVDYIRSAGKYQLVDSFQAQEDSPWSIFFRVDDDLLTPVGGEVWLGVNAIGVSNYTTDGSYWLEKKNGTAWHRLGGEETTASWAEETIRLVSQTQVRQVDWEDVYAHLEPGVYRMGKHFYNGSESIIQYAEFAIYQTGGIFGEGGEEAIARVDAAIDKLQSGNYRVEKYNSPYSDYGEGMTMTEVIWKYDTTMVTDYYNNVSSYSHSVLDEPGGFLYGDWLKRTFYPSEYDCIYFTEGYGLISEREIRFAYGYSRDAAENPCTLYTYRFDENGDLIYILKENRGGLWGGYQTLYVITDTPEEEIRDWVQTQKATK